jgi:hypothetical protein
MRVATHVSGADVGILVVNGVLEAFLALLGGRTTGQQMATVPLPKLVTSCC